MQTTTFVNHLEEIVQKLKIDQLIAILENFTNYRKKAAISDEEKKRFSDFIFQSQVNALTIGCHACSVLWR
jgi:hypothetical protein